jgi:hypothetical protein
MAYVARKPFLFDGVQYQPGDAIPGFPEEFFKSESLIRAGFVIEKKPVEVKPVRQTTAKAKIGA